MNCMEVKYGSVRLIFLWENKEKTRKIVRVFQRILLDAVTFLALFLHFPLRFNCFRYPLQPVVLVEVS